MRCAVVDQIMLYRAMWRQMFGYEHNNKEYYSEHM